MRCYERQGCPQSSGLRAAFPNLPAAFVERIVDSMSHFGLFRSDGTAKPGWGEFEKQVAGYYQRN